MSLSKIYNFYSKKIFPKIRHLRGATRFKIILRSRLLDQLEEYEGEPQSIFGRGEWDNLIILDACRFDKYNEMRDYEVESRITLGSTSSEYVERTFTEDDYNDIVYISANGFLTEEMMTDKLSMDSISFYEKFDTIKTDWDKDKGTVLPEGVVRDALTAENLFPKKKKIIHFIQPHYPYLTKDFGGRSDNFLPDDKADALERAERGEVPREEIIKAYEENLEIVVEYADQLADQLEGVTVVTADHGELLGENGLYSHPAGSKAKKLRRVPWDKIS